MSSVFDRYFVQGKKRKKSDKGMLMNFMGYTQCLHAHKVYSYDVKLN